METKPQLESLGMPEELRKHAPYYISTWPSWASDRAYDERDYDALRAYALSLHEKLKGIE